jgi:hypothetical protein
LTYAPNRRRVVDTRNTAKEIRETFQDRDVKRTDRMPWTWPDEMQVIGRCLGVIYSSDKWKESRDYEDYKHVSEAPQLLLATPDFLIDWSTDQPIPTAGPFVELPQPMPQHTAKLARFLGVQFRLYESVSDKGKGRLSDEKMEMRLGRAHLGAARVPDSEAVQFPTGVGLEPGDPFLFVFTPDKQGVHCIITGRELDIEADGIVG